MCHSVRGMNWPLKGECDGIRVLVVSSRHSVLFCCLLQWRRHELQVELSQLWGRLLEVLQELLQWWFSPPCPRLLRGLLSMELGKGKEASPRRYAHVSRGRRTLSWSPWPHNRGGLRQSRKTGGNRSPRLHQPNEAMDWRRVQLSHRTNTRLVHHHRHRDSRRCRTGTTPYQQGCVTLTVSFSSRRTTYGYGAFLFYKSKNKEFAAKAVNFSIHF